MRILLHRGWFGWELV